MWQILHHQWVNAVHLAAWTRVRTENWCSGCRHAKSSQTRVAFVARGQWRLDSGQWTVGQRDSGCWSVSRGPCLVAASSRFWPDKVIVATRRHLINGAGIRPTTGCMLHAASKQRAATESGRYDTRASPCSGHNE